METCNKVTVKIFGQEYTIVGETPADQITQVAAYVDEKMREISGGSMGAPLGPLAVLTAVNVADEYFQTQRGAEELKRKNLQLEQDAAKYVQLWEEAKKNFIQYKEQAQASAGQEESAKKQLAAQQNENEALRRQIDKMESEAETMQKKYADLLERLDSQEEAGESSKAELKNLEDKCREIENNFFDLQMENIQLKGELDRYKKIVESE